MIIKKSKLAYHIGPQVTSTYLAANDERNEPIPRFYENTDFSIETIRNSINDGESLTNSLLEPSSNKF
jgi:hypothetical protein